MEQPLTTEKKLKEGQVRLLSIDILRGLVIVIMALDHVREYWGITSVRPEDLTQSSALLFLTRWVTHLCAPTFVFLSGLSIYLYQQKAGSISGTRRFVFSRGMWLLFVEVAVISFIMVQGFSLTVLSVIWVIGCSMIIMAAIVGLPRTLLTVLGLIMIGGHNLLPGIQVQDIGDALLAMLHNTPFFVATPHPVLVTYTVVPWVGVMILGYCTGPWYFLSRESRRMKLLQASIGLIAIFLLVRAINAYGDPAPWTVGERGGIFSVLSFINVTKYPPSLLFLSLTLGIAFLILRVCDRDSEGRWGKFFAVYGRVPFFFFVMHFALISLSSMLWTRLQFGEAINLGFSNFAELPEAYQPNLMRVYFVWILVVGGMYLPCKWFGEYRKRKSAWWLKYL